MNRPLLAATASIALALTVSACGSVTSIDDLFNQNSGGAAATTTAGQGGAQGVTGVGGGSISSAATNPASVSASSGVTTASGPATTTTGPGPAGSSSSGPGVTASSSTGPGPASSSSGGPTNTVFCNNAECSPGQICCFNLSQQSDHCGQEGSCGDGFIELQCNGPEDCPGGVCCADVDFQMNPPYKSIACKQSCNNPQNELIVCSDADPTCPFGKQCGNSMVLGQGYKICK
jgi:hypothetical protein